MVHLLRRFQTPILIAVTFVVILSMTYFGVNSSLDKIGADRVGTIYNRSISRTQYMAASRKFEIARDLTLFELLQTLVGQATSMEQAIDSFIWNSLILRHEADRLGIAPTNENIVDAIKQLPTFQTNGAYDSTKYAQFVDNALKPRGFLEDQLLELVGDDLRLRKVKTLLGSTAAPAPSEVRSAYEQRNRVTELSVVRLKLADFTAAAQVPEEDVKKLYEERKETLKSPELRKVKFVAFTVANVEKPLVGKERVGAMEKLADKAGEFSVAMTEKDAKFEDVAAKFEVKVQEAGPFAQDNPPNELGQSDAVADAAFKLKKEEPNSDAITTENGYYVLQLVDVAGSHPLTYEEAKEKLTEELKQQRAQEAMNLKATEIRNKAESELKAGKTFADAVQAVGAKAEPFPPFSFSEPKLDQPDGREIMMSSMDLAEGQISPPVPVPTGVVLVHIDKRQPIDETKFEKEKSVIAENVSRSKSDAVLREWLKLRRNEAGVKVAQR